MKVNIRGIRIDKLKIKVPGVRKVKIIGDYIKLDALLKYASIASTGGEAKHRILSGEVFFRKEICTARGKKIRPGDVVRLGESVSLSSRRIYDNKRSISRRFSELSWCYS